MELYMKARVWPQLKNFTPPILSREAESAETNLVFLFSLPRVARDSLIVKQKCLGRFTQSRLEV